jgi:hypothetical protein
MIGKGFHLRESFRTSLCPFPLNTHPAENFADNNPATETASHDRNLMLLNPALFFALSSTLLGSSL